MSLNSTEQQGTLAEGADLDKPEGPEEAKGVRLWIVATPLGNPGDLSPRAAEVLEAADFVLAEDTRRSGILFSGCGVEVKGFVSLHEHNEEEQLPVILHQLETGRVAALVSDAGLPTLSDPGYRLIRACRKAGIRVSVVPGPSAVLTALAASGLAPHPFVFLGFLPRKDGEQAKLLAKFQPSGCSLVFFERKDRLAQTLQNVYSVMGGREVCIAREMTKTHEEFIFGRLGEWQTDGKIFPPENILGEITVVVGPAEELKRTEEDHLLALAAWMAADQIALKPKDLARKLAESAEGWTAKQVYQLLQSKQD